MDTLRRDTCSRAWFRGLYALVKDIYRLAEASAGVRRMDGSSRKGLSPLLAIIIGLIVTIVAGILLAQLYFSYAATISARPAANIEYTDLVADGDGGGVLTINIKNIGNVPINSVEVAPQTSGPTWDGCTVYYSETVTTSVTTSSFATGLGQSPGGTITVTCSITGGLNIGDVVNVNVIVGFSDGSTQAYSISVRARSA